MSENRRSDSQDNLNPLEMKKSVKMFESKLQSLKDKNRKMVKFEGTKLYELDSLYDCLVRKYDRLKIVHAGIKKNLELDTIENARFKFVTQCLMKKIKELTDGVTEDGCFEEDIRFDEDAFSLEEWSNQLIRELIENKKRAEKISEELNGVKERLATSKETRNDLKKCLDPSAMLEDPELMEKNWRAVCERQSAELANSGRVKNELREALNAKINEVRLIKQSARENSVKLRAEIDTLIAQLKEQETRQDALRVNFARLEEEARRRQMDVVCHNRLVSDLKMSSRPPGTDRCSWNQDHDGDELAKSQSFNEIESNPSTVNDSSYSHDSVYITETISREGGCSVGLRNYYN